MPARTLHLILGLWLFVSAFAFQRTPSAFTNAWIVGLASAVVALAAMTRAPARYVNTLLAAWLVVSAFALPHRSPAAFWHDVAAGLLMLLLSLVPGTLRPVPRRAEAAAR
jgi:multisubunit Na+/H+ antiporter MnhE subunit